MLSTEMPECWNGCWNTEMLTHWHAGMVTCWHAKLLQGIDAYMLIFWNAHMHDRMQTCWNKYAGMLECCTLEYWYANMQEFCCAAMVPQCNCAILCQGVCHGAWVQLCLGAVLLWCHGAVVSCCHAMAMVPWCRGAVVPWCRGWFHAAMLHVRLSACLSACKHSSMSAFWNRSGHTSMYLTFFVCSILACVPTFHHSVSM